MRPGLGGVAAACLKHLRRQASADGAYQPRTQHDGRKWRLQDIQREPGQGRQRPQQSMAQRARADAPSRLQNDSCHGRLDTRKQPRYQRRAAKGHIDPRQADQDKQRRQHKQNPGHDAAPCAVHQPAQVSGQLLRLRAG